MVTTETDVANEQKISCEEFFNKLLYQKFFKPSMFIKVQFKYGNLSRHMEKHKDDIKKQIGLR